VSTQIQIRRDTTANWESVNPTLADGEIGFDVTVNRFKVGDGVKSWTEIEYSGSTGTGSELVDGEAYIRLEDGSWVASPSMTLEGDLNISGNIVIDGGIVDPDGNPSGGGSYAVAIADTPPENGKSGDTWFDSTEGEGSLYIHDGDVWFSSNAFSKGSSGGSGGSGGSIEAIASGSLDTGEAVIVNADGTVSVVKDAVNIGEDIAAGIGNISAIIPDGSKEFSASYDPSTDSFLVAYRDGSLSASTNSSYYGFVLVAKISGDDVTYGTPVVLHSGQTDFISTTYDPNTGNHVIFYNAKGSDGNGEAIVATVSQGTVTLGAAVPFTETQAQQISSAYDSKNGKHVIAYRDSKYGYGKARPATVVGNTVLFGNNPSFWTKSTQATSIAYDPVNEKMLVTFYSEGATLSKVAEVSGDTLSFNGAETKLQNSLFSPTSVYDPSEGKVVVAGKSNPDGDKGKVYAGVISGDSVAFNSPVMFPSGIADKLDCCYDSASGKVIITYKDGDKGMVRACATGSLSLGEAVEIKDNYVESTAVSYSPVMGRSIVLAGRRSDSGITHTVDAARYSPGGKFPDTPGTTLTDTNYIGTSSADYSDGETATIQTVGSVSEDQSGLTAGLAYYVQPDGSLGTSGDVFAGTAISPTKLIVKG
jgi:hypothetical protein